MLNVEIACSEAATYKQRTVLCPVRICLRCKQVLTGTLTHAGILSQTGTAARMQWRGQQPCSCCQDAQEAFSHFIYFHLCLSEVALEHESLQIDVFLNVFLVNNPRFQFPVYCTKTCRNHTSRNVCHKTTVINGAEALKAFLNPPLD